MACIELRPFRAEWLDRPRLIKRAVTSMHALIAAKGMEITFNNAPQTTHMHFADIFVFSFEAERETKPLSVSLVKQVLETSFFRRFVSPYFAKHHHMRRKSVNVGKNAFSRNEWAKKLARRTPQQKLYSFSSFFLSKRSEKMWRSHAL